MFNEAEDDLWDFEFTVAKYEASRNLGEELLAAARGIKAGKAARVHWLQRARQRKKATRSQMSVEAILRSRDGDRR